MSGDRLSTQREKEKERKVESTNTIEKVARRLLLGLLARLVD